MKLLKEKKMYTFISVKLLVSIKKAIRIVMPSNSFLLNVTKL